MFRELHATSARRRPAHVALGSALLALGEPHEAAAEFDEAKRLKPDDWVVRDQIALAYSDCGDWTAAVEEQNEAVRRFPRFAVAHKALAHALQSAGRIEDAVAEFREAVRLDPRFSSAYLFLGRALIETGDFQAALDALARVDPGPPPADPHLSACRSVCSRQGYDDSGSTATGSRGGMRAPGRRRGGSVVRPARLHKAPACGIGSPVGRVIHIVAGTRSRPDRRRTDSRPHGPRRSPGLNVGAGIPVRRG